ncbi:Glycosyl transferase family 41 [Carpediemonas membranifera]|uniref:protein O-GlcNAc transferase n=1 Tax=Carpediemonas membranifera TaxID=201153 RepID=A0A8J6BTW5_9EUKA|nr:Glycosyl transferase family 41 [Carpediemonas membranifera]|eukprot:KAG9389751.1 Glycosyl transferase family 41 [Carpediemonas membranifera]
MVSPQNSPGMRRRSPVVSQNREIDESTEQADALNQSAHGACGRGEQTDAIVDALNQEAHDLYQRGEFTDALVVCERSLSIDPTQSVAHNTLGNVYRALGQHQLAIKSYEAAVHAEPDAATAFTNLANLYLDQGELKQSEQVHLLALERDSASMPSLMSLAFIYRQMHEYVKAADVCHRAFNVGDSRGSTLDPLVTLGLIFCEMGDPSKAIPVYKRVISTYPDRQEGYIGLSHALQQTGTGAQAYATFLHFINKFPEAVTAPVRDRAGCLCLHEHRFAEAIEHLKLAIELDPTYAPAVNNLGTAYRALGNLPDAVSAYLQAISLDPNYADPYSNLANVLKHGGDYRKALQYYTKALQLNPSFFDAHMNVGHLYKDHSRFEDAIGHYTRALEIDSDSSDALISLFYAEMCVGKWDFFQTRLLGLKASVGDQLRRVSGNRMAPLPSAQPFHALAMPLDDTQVREISRAYGLRCQAGVDAMGLARFSFDHLMQPGQVRIGYVSSDFGDHPLSHLMASVFSMHDRERVSVYCYALSKHDGSVYRDKVEADSDVFRDLSAMTDVEAARTIHGDSIHVLVNLNGYTRGTRNEICAMRPAPVIASMLGFPSTTGAPFIDYLVTDRVASPPDLGYLYSENLVFLPQSYFVTDHRQAHADLFTDEELQGACERRGEARAEMRRVYGIPVDAFVFACFNQVYKFDPASFTRWVRIVMANERRNAVLVLLRFPPEAEARLRAFAMSLGLEAERLVFLDTAPKAEHIRRGLIVDVFLDTWHCNGHTTVADILWAGVPVVTMPANTMASRVATSMLEFMGMGELVATSPEKFVEIANHLCRDSAYYTSIRSHLTAARLGPGLFDTAGWVRAWERAADLMVQQWRLGGRPVTFEVE